MGQKVAGVFELTNACSCMTKGMNRVQAAPTSNEVCA